MRNELYHAWLRKGEAAPDHKYLYREWKNGRWVYYYDTGKKLEPIGQNYRTAAQVEQERAAAATARAEVQAQSDARTERIRALDRAFDSLINKGRTYLNSLDTLLNSRVSDIGDMFDWFERNR